LQLAALPQSAQQIKVIAAESLQWWRFLLPFDRTTTEDILLPQ
jgi:hypothetical protein